MKFRVTKISVYTNLLSSPQAARVKRKYRALRSAHYKNGIVKSAERERIRISYLFEVAALDAPKKPRRRPIRAAWRRVRSAPARVGRAFVKLFTAIGNGVVFIIGRLVPRSEPRSIALLLGAFCAALTVALTSALILGAFLLSRYFMPHEEFVIPDLVGDNVGQAYELYGDKVEFSLTYVYSADHPQDTVLSQYPSVGVVKKLFSLDNNRAQMSLKVSLGPKIYHVEDLKGKSERDVLVELLKNEIAANIIKEYSDTVNPGHVIATVPEKDSVITKGDTLTLYVSLGRRISKISVPDLYNLTESGACLMISERGLKVGSITYSASSAPAGRVIAQSPAPFESLEEGDTVDITVSAGESFSSRLIPDLYGLTLTEAKQKLREAGLVLGSVYSVSSGAPSGTVVAQSPIPSSNIVSSITSVDVYISS